MPDRTRLFVRSLLLLLALAWTLPTASARAAGDDVNLSMCKQVLARQLCKKTSEFGYTGKLDEGVYIISVFYASKNSEFLCAVTGDGQVIIQDRTWRTMRRVIPYTLDSEGKCLIAPFSSPDCPVKTPIKACAPKGPQDAKEQQKETFWNRPIPKVLEEEYKAMSARDQQNASGPSAPAAPAAPAAQ